MGETQVFEIFGKRAQAKTFNQTLQQEKKTDALLSKLAQASVNLEAGQ
jgi:ferritin-like metal-binding protein YciE